MTGLTDEVNVMLLGTSYIHIIFFPRFVIEVITLKVETKKPPNPIHSFWKVASISTKFWILE